MKLEKYPEVNDLYWKIHEAETDLQERRRTIELLNESPEKYVPIIITIEKMINKAFLGVEKESIIKMLQSSIEQAQSELDSLKQKFEEL